jgi:hypothetical protein
MPNETKNAPDFKPGSLKAAHARIEQLEKALSNPHKCPGAKVTPLPLAYQFTGRVDRPSYGQALPAGVCFHSYVSVRVVDEQIKDQIVPPAEDEVLALLLAEADEQYPDNVGVTIADISVLPAGW